MLSRLSHAALLAVLLGGTIAAAQPPAAIRFPEPPATPVNPPVPAPAGQPFKLARGQVYAIQHDSPLVIEQIRGTGKVSVSAAKKGPITYDAKMMPGIAPDKDDAELVTLTSPFIYLVRPLESGPVELQVVPALNKLVAVKDKAGKDTTEQVPLKRADFVIKVLAVDMGDGPQPPPVDPPGPVDPLLSVLQAAYAAEPASATKASDKAALAAVFRALAAAVKDPVVKTGDDNFDLIHNSIQARVDGRLKTKLRPTIGAEIEKILPHGPGKGVVPLTAQNRADAAALYLRVATLLDQVK